MYSRREIMSLDQLSQLVEDGEKEEAETMARKLLEMESIRWKFWIN